MSPPSGYSLVDGPKNPGVQGRNLRCSNHQILTAGILIPGRSAVMIDETAPVHSRAAAWQGVVVGAHDCGCRYTSDGAAGDRMCTIAVAVTAVAMDVDVVDVDVAVHVVDVAIDVGRVDVAMVAVDVPVDVRSVRRVLRGRGAMRAAACVVGSLVVGRARGASAAARAAASLSGQVAGRQAGQCNERQQI